MSLKKSKSTEKGYRVSYTKVLYSGKEQRDVTKIVYKTKREAQKYADQLNNPNYLSTKNARVRKA